MCNIVQWVETAVTSRTRLPTSWPTPSCCSGSQAGPKKHLGRTMMSSLALWKSLGFNKHNPFKLTYIKEGNLLQGYRVAFGIQGYEMQPGPMRDWARALETLINHGVAFLSVSVFWSVSACFAWFVISASKDLLPSFPLCRLTFSAFACVAGNGHSAPYMSFLFKSQ